MDNKTNEIEKSCCYCSGTGMAMGSDSGEESITCPVCKGTAKVMVPADSSLHVVCDASGKIKFRRGGIGKQDILCPDCHGTGWFSPSTPPR